MPVAAGGASAPPTLTVAVLTLNEAHRIEACLQSAAFADQLLVVDSGSTDDTVALAHAQGYVQTVFGRRLYLPDINGGNGPRKKAAERAAINAPMQGTAADLIKKAMVAVQNRLDAAQPEVLLIMQVPALMAGVAQLNVPLLAEVGVGANWEQAH